MLGLDAWVFSLHLQTCIHHLKVVSQIIWHFRQETTKHERFEIYYLLIPFKSLSNCNSRSKVQRSFICSFYSRFYFIFEFFFLWNDIKWNLPLLTAFMFQNQSSIQLFLVYTCYEKGILLLMPSNFECQVPTAISFWILYPSLTGTCCWSNLFWDFGNHSIHPLFLSFQMVIPDFMNSKEKNRLLMRTGTKRKWRSSGCWKAKRWKIIWAATIKVMKRWTFAPRYA